MNQKGQAFSVFELMIAGVVAFAILIILLQVLGLICFGDGCGGSGQARDRISTSINTATPSGEATAQNFTLKKDEVIDVKDLAAKTDLDAESMFFLAGQLGDNQTVVVDSSVGGKSFVKFTGLDITMSAKVICKQTASDLQDSLSRLGDAYDLSASTADAYCGNSMPCCAIVLLKRQS